MNGERALGGETLAGKTRLSCEQTHESVLKVCSGAPAIPVLAALLRLLCGPEQVKNYVWTRGSNRCLLYYPHASYRANDSAANPGQTVA